MPLVNLAESAKEVYKTGLDREIVSRGPAMPATEGD